MSNEITEALQPAIDRLRLIKSPTAATVAGLLELISGATLKGDRVLAKLCKLVCCLEKDPDFQ